MLLSNVSELFDCSDDAENSVNFRELVLSVILDKSEAFSIARFGVDKTSSMGGVACLG